MKPSPFDRIRLAFTLGISLLSLLGAGDHVRGSSALDGQRPNILLLLSDDHSYPFVSTFGDTNVSTPNLDRLASEGFKGRRFFTACPQCVPSRAALMTGLSPVAARMTRFTSPLPKDQITFPEILKLEAAYHIGVCGRSYHLDGSGAQNNPVLERVLSENGLRTFQGRMDFVQNGPDREVPGIVSKFLDERPQDRPFFLWANFSDPHHVWDAPEKYRPNPAALKVPLHLPDFPGVREQLADYCAEVNRLDESVGNVLKEFEKRSLLDNTIIVFIGDNGAALPHGKGSLYDPGSNVPFIAKGPGIQPGGDSSNLLSGEDIGPTLLEAAGVSTSDKMTGQSFWGLLTGKPYQSRSHLFVERGPHGSAPVAVDMSSGGYDLGRAVRSDRYKLIYNCTPWIPYSPVDSAGGAAWTQMKQAKEEGTLDASLVGTYFTSPRPVYELYDLTEDPAELKNLAGTKELADVEDDLRAALIEKMVLDCDYLPLPAAFSEHSNRKPANGGRSNRRQAFNKLDRDGDGRLSWEEFRAEREPSEARNWFERRDTNKDGFVDRPEYLPDQPRAQ